LLGFDFGKPFRSRGIEIAGFAGGEWGRDGWIAFHNSYLALVYRAGIVGMLYIVFMVIFLIKIIKRSICLRSINGILLSGAIISILMYANFAVILELPYYAIPFWSLFGVTFAYLNELMGKGVSSDIS
ncbi:MAG: hypothetical protein KJ977_00660, partial [Candidatus Omnitrophica bacterium]|nr:hypothetical protein [Candidatus Omnitrophota bacterium]